MRPTLNAKVAFKSESICNLVDTAVKKRPDLKAYAAELNSVANEIGKVIAIGYKVITVQCSKLTVNVPTDYVTVLN